MTISDGEKIIISLLSDIHKHLDIKGDLDLDLVMEAISSGHYWALTEVYPGIFHGSEDSGDVRSETADILDMWDCLERSYEELTQISKDKIAQDAAPVANSVKFPGFDGNNEAEHLSMAHFLVEKLGRWPRFEGRVVNSHMPVIDIYKRMLTVFLPIQKTLGGGDLSPDEITQIMKAPIHPGSG